MTMRKERKKVTRDAVTVLRYADIVCIFHWPFCPFSAVSHNLLYQTSETEVCMERVNSFPPNGFPLAKDAQHSTAQHTRSCRHTQSVGSEKCSGRV